MAAVDEVVQAVRVGRSSAKRIGIYEKYQICNENGIQYVERLAARRQKRYFADLCDQHPLWRTAIASDLLGAAPIVRGIAA